MDTGEPFSEITIGEITDKAGVNMAWRERIRGILYQ